jgi:hypothetical protein
VTGVGAGVAAEAGAVLGIVSTSVVVDVGAGVAAGEGAVPGVVSTSVVMLLVPPPISTLGSVEMSTRATDFGGEVDGRVVSISGWLTSL